MRKYKFRAWDKNNTRKKMMYSKTEIFDDMIGFRFEHFDGDVEDIKIMQWTGHKDTRGYDIYEGDVVQAGRWRGKVYFDNSTQAFMLKDLSYKYADSINFMSQYDSYQVIGNIFENPELIKEANDERD